MMALYSYVDYYSLGYRFCWNSYTPDVLLMILAVKLYSNVKKCLSQLPEKCCGQVMQIWKHQYYLMKDQSFWHWLSLIVHLNMTWIHLMKLPLR